MTRYYKTFEELYESQRAFTSQDARTKELLQAVRTEHAALSKDQLERSDMMHSLGQALLRISAGCEIFECTFEELIQMVPFKR